MEEKGAIETSSLKSVRLVDRGPVRGCVHRVVTVVPNLLGRHGGDEETAKETAVIEFDFIVG